MTIIAARNELEDKVGILIQEFEEKIEDFFSYIRQSKEGKRLVVKMKSHVSENEIYDDFAKIYRRYKAIYISKVGDYFFKETRDLVEKLCDDFEDTMREDSFVHILEAPSYIYLDTDNFEIAEIVFFRFIEFIQSLGFSIKSQGSFIQGLWIRRGIEAIKKIGNSAEAEDIYRKGKKALELATIDKVQSEVNKNNAEAAAALFTALKDVDNAAMNLGPLVLIKTNINGQTQAIVHVLSTEQVLFLESRPELLNKPSLLLESLDLSSRETPEV